MAFSGKGFEGIETAARAMAQEMTAQVRNQRPCPSSTSTSTESSSPGEEPEQPPAPRDP
ncbi:hypothetical protein SAMN04489727_5740 [Amycolatopsis tolypomycina]|uniref:Uncharacterized protein n=1 Tax=Amycolatopsis tolypomycina TaxID=208445 RepID=A0A1H4WQ47_9PSEU|nr:hypothetical protein [Amycolatopsis tolypomycina]SEC95463.1 hypothetical protein SAMN04489727_5740 [Amycolatopsis tolypomycina]